MVRAVAKPRKPAMRRSRDSQTLLVAGLTQKPGPHDVQKAFLGPASGVKSCAFPISDLAICL